MMYSVLSPRERLIIEQTSRDLQGNKVEGLDSCFQLGSNQCVLYNVTPIQCSGFGMVVVKGLKPLELGRWVL